MRILSKTESKSHDPVNLMKVHAATKLAKIPISCYWTSMSQIAISMSPQNLLCQPKITIDELTIELTMN